MNVGRFQIKHPPINKWMFPANKIFLGFSEVNPVLASDLNKGFPHPFYHHNRPVLF